MSATPEELAAQVEHWERLISACPRADDPRLELFKVKLSEAQHHLEAATT